jgi:hypothetical protein
MNIDVSEIEEHILTTIDHIMAEHKGRANAIKFASLLAAIRYEIYPLTICERSLRELVEARRGNICFCTTRPGGYFIPSDDRDTRRAELKAVIHSLDGYLIGAAKRKKAILLAYPEDAQMGLSL